MNTQTTRSSPFGKRSYSSCLLIRHFLYDHGLSVGLLVPVWVNRYIFGRVKTIRAIKRLEDLCTHIQQQRSI